MVQIAQESRQIQRSREKLARNLGEQEITKEALAKAVEGIHKWIADNASNRVPVETKEMGLFNSNKNAAEVSKKVATFAKTLLRNGEFR